MHHNKPPERRTFLQDRLDILIKKQRTGQATFNELTELDDMVNADPVIRNRIIRENLLLEEMDDFNEPSNYLEKETGIHLQKVRQPGLLTRIKSFFSRIFSSLISSCKINNIGYSLPVNAVLL